MLSQSSRVFGAFCHDNLINNGPALEEACQPGKDDPDAKAKEANQSDNDPMDDEDTAVAGNGSCQKGSMPSILYVQTSDRIVPLAVYMW